MLGQPQPRRRTRSRVRIAGALALALATPNATREAGQQLTGRCRPGNDQRADLYHAYGGDMGTTIATKSLLVKGFMPLRPGLVGVGPTVVVRAVGLVAARGPGVWS